MLADLLANGLDIKFAARNRANNPEVVTRRTQKHGDSPRHHNAVQDGFVAVAVHDHHITRSHGMVPDNLVAGTGAVGHEKAVISVENTRGIAFAGANGPVVIQQLAQFFHGIADVGTQHVLAKKLVKNLPDRAFQKGYAAGMTGAMP